jgi:protein-S-isoprenylcysteine O-methyltransferase Ste14
MPAATVIEPDLERPKAGAVKRTLLVAVTTALWIAIAFAAAGTLNWIRGWICVSVYVVTLSATGVLVRRTNPGLMKVRSSPHWKDTKAFDKVILLLFLPLSFAQPAIAGLDAVRFHWSSMPFQTVYWGFALLEFSMAIITWAMMVNPHAESTVRIQKDRGHTPVTSGPYRIVRHPMYVGMILMYPATALMFGSKWALVVGCAIAILMVFRTAMEDRTLRRELPGYEDFAHNTRYRLIPGLW